MQQRLQQRLLIPILLLTFFLLSLGAWARSQSVINDMAQQIAGDISANPSISKPLYAESFLKAVPWEKLAALYQDLLLLGVCRLFN